MVGIFWSKVISNLELIQRTGMEKMDSVIRRRTFRYMGDLYRGVNEVGREAIKWTPYWSRRGRQV